LFKIISLSIFVKKNFTNILGMSYLYFPHQPTSVQKTQIPYHTDRAGFLTISSSKRNIYLIQMGKLESRSVEDLQLTVPFKPFAIVTVSLPAFSLLYCFLHGMIFRFSDVNETVCKVLVWIQLHQEMSFVRLTFLCHNLGRFFAVRSDSCYKTCSL
jgi:hypothetical protein